MKFTQEHTFAASVDRVVALFADPAFAAERAAATGTEPNDEPGPGAWVDGSADGEFTVSIRRVVPASSIPSEFRGFVGKDLHARYTEVWRAPGPGETDRVGTFAVEIVGAPGHAAGAVGLTPKGESTEFLATGEVKVSIPLVGGMIEKVVVDAVLKGLRHELVLADSWLTR